MTENDALKREVNKLHDMYFGRKKRRDVEVDTLKVVPQDVTSSVEPAPEGEAHAKHSRVLKEKDANGERDPVTKVCS